MTVPFTRDQFLAVFADYNAALWPMAAALWVATAVVSMSLWRSGSASDRAIASLLSIHWAWAGIAYHAAFFRAINPAAPLFAVAFVTESALIGWYGLVRRQLTFRIRQGPRLLVARALVAYGLLYPFIAWADGFAYPFMPTFGVPCPTTILSIGFLVAADAPIPLPVVVVPIIWSAVGASAALVFGVRADLMLPLAGLALTLQATVGGRRNRQGGMVRGSALRNL